MGRASGLERQKSMNQEECRVEENRSIADGFYSMILQAPLAAAAAAPGQFVHVSCEGSQLCRPISICESFPAEGRLRLVYEVRGTGTAWMSRRRVGDTVRILAPLGHGFTPPQGCSHPVLVGGGLGVPPLLQLAKGLETPAALLGFRSGNVAILADDFRRAGAQVEIATDDGSLGRQGLVTDLLRERIGAGQCDYIAACGPLPMLAGVSALAREAGIPCQISLEERMGCGMGACLVCVCKVRRADGEGYARVCADGPVFWAQEVCL